MKKIIETILIVVLSTFMLVGSTMLLGLLSPTRWGPFEIGPSDVIYALSHPSAEPGLLDIGWNIFAMLVPSFLAGLTTGFLSRTNGIRIAIFLFLLSFLCVFLIDLLSFFTFGNDYPSFKDLLYVVFLWLPMLILGGKLGEKFYLFGERSVPNGKLPDG